MTNPFEKELGIPLPKCCSLGSCCKGASPSTPYRKLLKRAVDGDDFARGFFSIMVPYPSHEAAEQVVPGLVERSLKAAKKLDDFQNPDDLVFYHCRYQTADNQCGVWEDRPQFCRDYPDTPFVVMAPGCAFESWGQACKEKYQALKSEVSKLKALKEELNTLYQQQANGLEGQAIVLPASIDSETLLSALSSDSMAFGAFVGSGSEDDSLSMPPDRAVGQMSSPALDGLTSSGENPYSPSYTKIDASGSGLNNTDTLSLVLSLTGLYVSSPLRSAYFLY